MTDSMKGTVDDFGERLEAFRETAQEISGPLGSLLKTIAWAQQTFAEAAERRGTTQGELNRMVEIVDEAIRVAQWLRSRDCDTTLVPINVAELIAEVADSTTAGHVLRGKHCKPEPPDGGVA